MRFSHRTTTVAPSATVSISDRAMQMRSEGLDVIDLAAGRASEHSPVIASEAVIAAIRNHDVHQTMARGTAELRSAAAVKLQRDNGITADPERHILASSGAKNGLVLAALSILDSGDEVLIEDPCFVSYEPTLHHAAESNALEAAKLLLKKAPTRASERASS